MDKERAREISRKQVIGQRVITLDNSGRVWEGVLTHFETQHGLPSVEINDKNYICMGVLLPYSPELHSFILELDEKNRWKIVSGMTKFCAELNFATG